MFPTGSFYFRKGYKRELYGLISTDIFNRCPPTSALYTAIFHLGQGKKTQRSSPVTFLTNTAGARPTFAVS